MRAMGNHHADREVQGTDLMQLALYQAIFPKATISKCRAYLYNIDPTKDPYSGSQVHQAEHQFGILASESTKHELYWTLPPLLGMRGVPISDIVDVDEAGFFLEHSDQRHGKTVLCLRCSQNGVYRNGEKVNLLLAI
jgi:hypothetical protein